MENNSEFTQLTNQLAQSIEDEIYTTLLDQGVDPALAYESTFNSGWTLADDLAEFPGKSQEELDAEIDNWVPIS